MDSVGNESSTQECLSLSLSPSLSVVFILTFSILLHIVSSHLFINPSSVHVSISPLVLVFLCIAVAVFAATFAAVAAVVIVVYRHLKKKRGESFTPHLHHQPNVNL